MNRQEAISNLASAMDLINGLDHVLWESIEALVTDASPDHFTGLVPCGCGGKAEFYEPDDECYMVGFEPDHEFYMVGVECSQCHVSTCATRDKEHATHAWNRAMGCYKGGAE